jgi:GT2 family glycosyltransferase
MNPGRAAARRSIAEHRAVLGCLLHQTSRDMPSCDDVLTEPGEDYTRWVATYDTLNDADRSTVRSECLRLKQHPLISLVVASGNCSLELLNDTLASVQAQLYTSWEVLLAVPAGLVSQMRGLPLEHILDDSRVRKIEVTGNYHRPAATNAALAAASGEFAGFLSPGDRLSEDALYQIAAGIAADGNIDLLYTDEDSIDSSGLRQEPRFKPGWDRDLLLASNYVGQFAVFRGTLLKETGDVQESTEEATYWHLLLRAAAALTDDRVQHLPLICYHRRKEDAGSSLECIVPDSSIRILSEHLRACGEPPAELLPAAPGTNYIRVVRPVPEPPPLVSVIIPTRDHVDLLQQCVEGLLSRTNYPRLELLIVDNDSKEADALAFLGTIAEKDRRVRVLKHPSIFNYSAMNNAAAREAQGEVLLLLNDDIEVISPDWLGEMVSQVVRPEVGAVGAKLLYPDGRLQHGGVVLGPDGAVTHLERFAGRSEGGYLHQLSVLRSLSAVTGACMAIRRDVYQEAGGLEEARLLMSCNDIDLCLRLGDMGYKIIWTPFAELVHHESASRGNPQYGSVFEQEVREQKHLRATWGRLLNTDDPFHNPNVVFGFDKSSIPISPPRRASRVGALGRRAFRPAYAL